MTDIALPFPGPAANHPEPSGHAAARAPAAGACPCSLRWQLVSRLVWFQAGMLVGLGLLVFAVLSVSGHLVSLEADDGVIEAVSTAAVRTPQGQLALQPTPALDRLTTAMPGVWFQIRDRAGQVLTHGTVPTAFAEAAPALDGVGQARLGWNMGDPPKAGARMKWVNSAAGPVQILTGSGGQMPSTWIAQAALEAFATFVVPAIALMTLATVLVTPLVVRRALAGLSGAAAQAARIDVDDRDARLPTAEVPREVLPLVQAVNAALDRLDQGYERRQRFLVDAAHELRTPIAILQTRLEGLGPSADKTRLLADLARLSTLAEQVLDLQRVSQGTDRFAPLDLVALARNCVADLAPLAIAAGFDLAFETGAATSRVMGDASALERVLVNLVQNAITHAGTRGHILVRVDENGVMDVLDDGPGIPAELRAHVFEPFQTLRPRGTGAGLGLHLVGEIVRRHRGTVKVEDAPGGGARFRVALPPLAG